MRFTATDISVIIPSYNSHKTLGACLDSLLAQEESPREIIVVDSSEGDETLRLLAAYPEVRVRKVPRRIFPGPARNRGAKLAGGSVLAFIDADCVAEPDWTRRIAGRHDEGACVVGGAVEVGNPANLIAWAGHLGEFREFLPLGKLRLVKHIPTCNISYRKGLFESMGGFPDAYYPQEDLLFNHLLSRRGVEILFDPDIRVRHFCREDLRGYLSHQHRIGRVTRSTLKRIHLEGSSIARNRFLAWALSPALGLLKLWRTGSMVWMPGLTDLPVSGGSKLQLLGLIALGAFWWARGFAAGARKGLSGIHGWDDPNEAIFALLESRAADKMP